ncbi:ATP-grasp domain-containing protein [Legionella anisa]|uniref:ATP-grasp domain-containing protein n=1 Tax=Legionella anisa TaxID=28082 RepID=A0AAX0WPB6_9GAMM|nr:ATP-grasp domain-containing protein [Legionella anisa]AWN73119.1 ATP-grasp domain-containing protein [Legionella anisa]KTC67446.1 phosphoribosylglycinamide synthetase ATP-grasp (A) domain protein [Legionella anisa]MCW8423949.1 ATP-grasp domain-containing protein [Legionella anisa]MCW8447471.1 ATP-grasp domain-containing protein [Legionella anisa]PNL60237.1 ATP-grasp domain-containing protein [Legionella anisa]
MSKSILFVDVSNPHNLVKIEAAKELGIKVFLVAPNLPDWAKEVVDKFIRADTTNIVETISTLNRECKDTPFDGVITILDKSVELVAAIAEEFKLPGSSLKAATTVKHKYKMREALKLHDVPHPKFQFVKTIADLQHAANTIGFPLIFKPVAASTSVAVFKLNSQVELEDAFERMSTCERVSYWLYSDEYIAEEFMEGQEVSVEGIINHAQVYFAGITKKFVKKPGFTEWMHCFPYDLDLHICSLIYKVVEAAISAVGINNCAFHIEVMLTAEGPKIVEMNSRMAGGFVSSHLVPLASGIDLAKASIQTALGESIELKATKNKFACERNLFATENGTIQDWRYVEEVSKQPGVKDFKLLRQVNEVVKVPPEGYDNLLCAVITEGDSFQKALDLAESALSRVHCVYQ